MAITLSLAKYKELGGRDSLERASIWQGNAGSIYGLNAVYAASGAAQATTATQAKTVNTTPYTVGGRLFSKGATDNFWTLGVAGSATVVAASSWQKYLLCVDDAGAATVVEGTQSTVSAAAVTWGNIAAAQGANPKNLWASLISVLNASRCIFAVATVATDSTHTFTPGTTAFNGTGITTTFIDGIDSSLYPLMANESGLLVGLKI